ncbi:hypothetical protein HHI36_008027 [Cryptolaemus montrouzieri]|uniref:FYVE-type domain-containing protein n=1 Tax=Cryptolaemus montrouzieri TaxID=559131 RepID=A0ABD2MR98_9CUCU
MQCTNCESKGNNKTHYKCDSCAVIYCIKCSNLTVTEERCVALKERKLKVFCNTCLSDNSTIMSNNRKLKKENDRLKEKLNEISFNSEPNNMSEELERLKKEHESNMTKLELELKAQSELNITLN